MQRNRRLATLAAALLLVIAPACGGDDDEPEAAAGGGGGTVSIEDFVYKPAELTVKSGATVTFTNKDGFAHTVTAKDRSYDSENLDEGQSFEHTYDEPGTYEYFCAIHNSMTGSVVVE